MELVVPAPISAAQRERVRRHRASTRSSRSGCSGLARVDFFVTDEGQVLVNELNTIPGFTSTSVFARLFEASGVPYVELLDRLLGLRARAPRARTRTATTAEPLTARRARWTGDRVSRAAPAPRSRRSSPPVAPSVSFVIQTR